MKDGLYSVFFKSNTQDFGAGVVSVKNDAVNGGDYAFYYQGKINNNNLRLHVKQFNPGSQSVFGPLNDFYLVLAVSEKEPHGYILDGSMEGSPHLNLQVSATKISDLTE
ncbi:negative regulator GrlR [Klebsiella michiganensis]|uniref:GrlR family regulatory protein n=1 Tax=Enterobacteriaceae TaxID=543 RepID=UPI0015F3B5B3|nr:GrlR family regulatory protein [Klebsiella michiganensis]MBA8051250.1 negative regulator GrlR [Klebsiella michiganensis]